MERASCEALFFVLSVLISKFHNTQQVLKSMFESLDMGSMEYILVELEDMVLSLCQLNHRCYGYKQ